MSQSVVIDSAGRIVLPSEIRRRLQLVPGSRLTLDVVAQRIELTPQAQAEPEMELTASRRTVLRATGKPFDAAAATRAEREDQSRRCGLGAAWRHIMSNHARRS